MNFRSLSKLSLHRPLTSPSQATGRKSYGQKLFRRIWPTILGILFAWLVLHSGLAVRFEAIAGSALEHWHAASFWDQRIVLVKVDPPTVDRLGWYPIKRNYYAQALNQLRQAGHNTAVLNFIFSESAPEDKLLEEAIRNHGYVVLSNAWTATGKVWQPTAQLESAAIAVGHLSITSNELDPEISQVPLLKQSTPALSLAALQAYNLGGGDAAIGNISDSPLRINWPLSLKKLPQYSLVDVIDGKIDTHKFDEKIVLVGATLPGLDQQPKTLDGEPVYGVHIHAAAINNLLRQDSLHIFPTQWLVGLLWGLGLSWGAGLSYLQAKRQITAMYTMPFIWLLASSLIYQFLNYRLPVALPILLFITISIGVLWRDRLQADITNTYLRTQINLDTLTQVKNRYFLERSFEELWLRLRRDRSEVSVILCDIDHFKLYNDSQGHIAGDKCLYRVAQSIQRCLKRPEDFVSRYGGEEFAVVLPHTSQQGAIQVAEQIQLALEKLALPHPQARPIQRVTMSLGVATGRVSDYSAQLLLQTADQALYKAKRLGRNRIAVADR